MIPCGRLAKGQSYPEDRYAYRDVMTDVGALQGHWVVVWAIEIFRGDVKSECKPIDPRT